MTQYEGKKYEDRLSIMHYNDKTSMYKVLAANPTEKNDGIFFSIREGVKGEKSNRLTLMLNKQEIAYTIMELTKIYNEL